MKYICTLITVSDINKSRSFYENILECEVKYDFGENVTFHGDFSIHLDSHFKGLIDSKEITHGGNNIELYFEHDDVEQFAVVLEENGIELVHPVREQPWRQKVVRFYDPDKHIIEVGESMEFLSYRLSLEGMNIEEISKTTIMPVEFVTEAIKKFG